MAEEAGAGRAPGLSCSLLRPQGGEGQRARSHQTLLREAGNGVSPGGLEGVSPWLLRFGLVTVASDVWPPGLCDNRCVLFSATTFMAIFTAAALWQVWLLRHQRGRGQRSRASAGSSEEPAGHPEPQTHGARSGAAAGAYPGYPWSCWWACSRRPGPRARWRWTGSSPSTSGCSPVQTPPLVAAARRHRSSPKPPASQAASPPPCSLSPPRGTQGLLSRRRSCPSPTAASTQIWSPAQSWPQLSPHGGLAGRGGDLLDTRPLLAFPLPCTPPSPEASGSSSIPVSRPAGPAGSCGACASSSATLAPPRGLSSLPRVQATCHGPRRPFPEGPLPNLTLPR